MTHPDALPVRLGGAAPCEAGRVAVRAWVIEWYLPTAVYLARRFRGRGEPPTGLARVTVIGLIKSVDRYDADRGLEFASYAILTTRGVVKRSFRDTAWNVRVPRRLAELKLQLTTITEDPAHVSHRSPTTAELAARLGVSRDVLTARHCVYAYRPLTFGRPASGIEDLRPIDSLGGPDFGIKALDKRETIRLRLAELPERKRRIITLRCIAGMTQAKVAAEIGVPDADLPSCGPNPHPAP